MRDPLLLPLAAIAAGVAVARYVEFPVPETWLALSAFAALGLVAWRRRARGLTLCCAWLALLFAGVWTALVHRPGPPPVLDAEAREVVLVGGCVVEPPALADSRERFILEIEPGARALVTLYARDDAPLPTLRYGQRVDLEARLRKPRNFLNPGAFDYARYLARQDIYWTGTAASSAVTILPGRCGSRFQAVIMTLRTAALERIARFYPRDPYQSGMMQAILIGQTFQMQRVWTENYRSTGTFHALVISGAHVAVLAGALLLLLRLLFVPRGLALAIAVAAAWLYALVTGWQAPCVRSAAGMTLFLVTRYFYRQGRILNILAAVAIGFLALDPEQLFDASFQLTFLAVGFIGAFAAPFLEATSLPLRRGLRDLPDVVRDATLPPRAASFRVEMRLLAEAVRLWTRLSERAACLAVTLPAWVIFQVYEIVVISGMIQVGLALPMVVYFHRVGLSGLSANALVVPLLGLVVPLGFAAIFTGWVWVAKLAGGLLAASRIAVDWHARLEPNWRVPTPPVWLGVALAVALIVAGLRGARWLRIAGALAVATLTGILLVHPFAPEIVPRQLEMTAIDVGQGDSILVVSPEGRLMLVDGGGILSFGPHPRASLDIGEDVVAPYLWNRSIRKIDVLVCTHAHDDHIGGLPALMTAFRVNELWTGATPESPQWDKLRAAARARGARIVPMRAGQSLAWGGVHVDALAPEKEYEPGPVPRNNDSLVLRIAYGAQAFFLPGDVERPVEWGMLAGGRLAPTAVLKVAHHGSKTSTTEEFLGAVRPLFAVISAGFENSYGHPHPDVLARLRERGVMVLRTDRDGLVTVRTDGRRITLDTARWQGTEPALRQVF